MARAWLTVAALLATACGSRGPEHDHEKLAADAEPLRSAFNADSGVVRAIYLASPT
jgi:hypothetical protein